jgi:hypothetical protein
VPASSVSTHKNWSSISKKVDRTSSETNTSRNSQVLLVAVEKRSATIGQKKVKFTWWVYEGSDEEIDSPTVTLANANITTGDLYFYRTTIRQMTPDSYQAWIFANNGWEEITNYWQSVDGTLRHPTDSSRILTARDDGTPSYVAESTWKAKLRVKEKISASVAASP